MKPELSSPEMQLDVREPIDLFCDFAMLVVESRVPSYSANGHTTGPHCPSLDGTVVEAAHEKCSRHDKMCNRASRLKQQLVQMYHNKLPVMIEVFLYPDCVHGADKAFATTATSGPPRAQGILLEQWTVQMLPKRDIGGKITTYMLLQAARSYLHFSQLSAWWNVTQGVSPVNVGYRLCVPGEAVCGKFEGVTDMHTFPSPSVSKSVAIKITVQARTRSSSIPTVLCFESHCQVQAQSAAKNTFACDVSASTGARSKKKATKKDNEDIPQTKQKSESPEDSSPYQRPGLGDVSSLRSSPPVDIPENSWKKLGKSSDESDHDVSPRTYCERKTVNRIRRRRPTGPFSIKDKLSLPQPDVVCNETGACQQGFYDCCPDNEFTVNRLEVSYDTEVEKLKNEAMNSLSNQSDATYSRMGFFRRDPAEDDEASGHMSRKMKWLKQKELMRKQNMEKLYLQQSKVQSAVSPMAPRVSLPTESGTSLPRRDGSAEEEINGVTLKPIKMKGSPPSSEGDFDLKHSASLMAENTKIVPSSEIPASTTNKCSVARSTNNKSGSTPTGKMGACETGSLLSIQYKNSRLLPVARTLFKTADGEQNDHKAETDGNDRMTLRSTAVRKGNDFPSLPKSVSEMAAKGLVPDSLKMIAMAQARKYCDKSIDCDLFYVDVQTKAKLLQATNTQGEIESTKAKIPSSEVAHDGWGECAPKSSVKDQVARDDKAKCKFYVSNEDDEVSLQRLEHQIQKTQKCLQRLSFSHENSLETQICDVSSAVMGNCETDKIAESSLSRLPRSPDGSSADTNVPDRDALVNSVNKGKVMNSSSDLQTCDDSAKNSGASSKPSFSLGDVAELKSSSSSDMSESICDERQVMENLPIHTGSFTRVPRSPTDLKSNFYAAPCTGLAKNKGLLRNLFKGEKGADRQKNEEESNGVFAQAPCKSVPSAMDRTRFRRSLDSAASMIFNRKTNLPSSSSPAPLRRGNSAFEFDPMLTRVSNIKYALSCSKLECQKNEEENECSSGPLSTSAPASSSSSLLGNFEESVLNGRLEPSGTVEGFTAEIGASGSFCPAHINLPVTAFFYNVSEDDAPSPYLGHINLGKKGYRVPSKGTIQVTLFNPNKTVVKMFVVMYDLTDMPVNSQTFLRQRTFYMPPGAVSTDDGPLRFLIHLRFASSKSGKIYLHTDIRMLFSRTLSSDIDANMPMYELRSFTEMPVNPRFSPRR